MEPLRAYQAAPSAVSPLGFSLQFGVEFRLVVNKLGSVGIEVLGKRWKKCIKSSQGVAFWGFLCISKPPEITTS